MRLFHLTKYTFYRPDFFRNFLKKRKDPFRIALIADLHFSYKVTDRKLNSLIKFLKKREPRYILMPGDFVDSLTMIQVPGEQERFLDFIKKLAKVAPLMISMGNHDVYEKLPNKRGSRAGLVRGWKISTDTTLIARMAALPNVHVLNDAAYEDDDVYFVGFANSNDYYNITGKGKDTPFNPRHESVKQMGIELDALDQKLLKDLPKHKLKIALIHSPVCLKEKEITDRLKEFDYFVSGHMHNGIVPPVFDEIIRNSGGLLSPTKELFPTNARNTMRKNGDKLIVTGAVTTFHECTGPIQYLNALYPSYITELNFSKDKKYKRKPGISRKYYNWPSK